MVKSQEARLMKQLYDDLLKYPKYYEASVPRTPRINSRNVSYKTVTILCWSSTEFTFSVLPVM